MELMNKSSVEPHQGEITKAVKQLIDAKNDIHQKIGLLETRLEPVCSTPDAKDRESKPGAESAYTPLGEELQELLASMIAATDRLIDLYNSVKL